LRGTIEPFDFQLYSAGNATPFVSELARADFEDGYIQVVFEFANNTFTCEGIAVEIGKVLFRLSASTQHASVALSIFFKEVKEQFNRNMSVHLMKTITLNNYHRFSLNR
jgi:hypothetical protein